jgi:hypothetical protein
MDFRKGVDTARNIREHRGDAVARCGLGIVRHAGEESLHGATPLGIWTDRRLDEGHKPVGAAVSMTQVVEDILLEVFESHTCGAVATGAAAREGHMLACEKGPLPQEQGSLSGIRITIVAHLGQAVLALSRGATIPDLGATGR